jgi:hypothetical protein
LEQVENTCKKDDVPIVIMRGDGSDSMVLMRLHQFLPMLAGEMPRVKIIRAGDEMI